MKTIIRVKPNKQDSYEGKPHNVLTRRDFLKRGLATTTLSTLAPSAVMAMLAKKAYGCPTSMRSPGGIAQLYRSGGCAMGATFIHAYQASWMTDSIASDYGFSGASALMKYGSNWYLDPTSPFGMGVLTPPAGWKGTGVNSWLSALGRTSLGGNYGPFNADDSVGNSLGQLAGCGIMKPSLTTTDVSISQTSPRTGWAKPLSTVQPHMSINTIENLTPAAIQGCFQMFPASGMNTGFLNNTAKASDLLSQLFMPVFGSGRSGAQQAVTSAVCGFYNDATIADPNFAALNFDPTQITALTNAMTVSSLSPEFQSFLVAFYQSNLGTIGSVSAEQMGCDYHPPALQTEAAPLDFEAGQIFAMWLAAAVVAGQGTSGSNGPGSAFIMNSNGRVHCNGVLQNQISVNGTMTTVNGPVSVGDGGGSYNAGLIVLYSPSSAPTIAYNGNFNTVSGAVSSVSAVSSVPAALASLYLTALDHLKFPLAPAFTLLQNAGIPNPSVLSLLENGTFFTG